MMTLIGGGLVSFWGPVVGVVRVPDRARRDRRADQRLDAVVRAVVHGDRAVQAGGHRRLAVVAACRSTRRSGAQGGSAHAPAVREADDGADRGQQACTCASATASCWRSIDLAVPEGEFHGIMGPNGAGKTTFFNVLTGRVKPSRGRSGSTARTSPGCRPHRIAAQGRRALVPDHDAVRRVHRARERHGGAAGVPRARLRHAPRAPPATAALHDRARRGARRRRPCRQGAMSAPRTSPTATAGRSRSRVALAQSPRVLCLDEPTSGLGTDGVQRLAALVGRLKGKLTIVAIEHDMEFLFALADRISVIHWGQVVARGTPRRAAAEPMGQALQPRAGSHDPRGRQHRYLLRRDAGAVRRLAGRRAGRGRSRCSAPTAPARPRRCARSSA